MIALLGVMLLTLVTAVPTPAALAAGLNGRWQGSLGYRDFQSNALQEIPVAPRIEALPDGVTTLRISIFDDGSKAGNVIITTASLYDPSTGAVTSTSLRKGRPVELSTEQISVMAFTDATHWTILSEQNGQDDDRPALIRITEVRDGDLLTATKQVQPQGGKDGWQFRNRTKLVR